MLSRTETIATTAQNWLTQFETALARPDDVLLKTLFHADSYWRDLLALTWRIRTANGAWPIFKIAWKRIAGAQRHDCGRMSCLRPSDQPNDWCTKAATDRRNSYSI